MNIWTILGIEPTTEVKAIRRAYAAQSKLCHPEEKPEEFKQLRNAYEQALCAAETGVEQSVSGVFTEHDNIPEQNEEPINNVQTHDFTEPEETYDDVPKKAPPELDFNALFTESAEQRLQEALESVALKGITERLGDPKRRNNKAAWKEFFFSDDFLKFRLKPDSLFLLAEFLRRQNDVPFENLPRIFCVWLSIISGIPDYEATGFSAKIVTHIYPPIAEVLAGQTYAQYNQSETKKDDYDINRFCFAVLNDVLQMYETLCETNDAAEWSRVLKDIESSSAWRDGRADYCKILVFLVRHLQIPNPVKVIIYNRFDMDNFEVSSKKSDIRELYEEFTKDGIEAFTASVREQNASYQQVKSLLNSIRNILHKHRVFANPQSERNKNDALAEMRVLTENPDLQEVWLLPQFIESFKNTYCSGVYRGSDCFRQLLRMIGDMYEQNKTKNGVSFLLESIHQSLESNETQEIAKSKEIPLTYFPFPENVSEHFAVLQELDGIIKQKTEGFSYRDNVILALFAMARTCVITNILSPISERFERYYLRHIREMPGYLLKWLMGEPVKKEDCSWWYVKSTVNSMTRETHFDGNDVKAITDTPEIIFENYQSFLATWFHFARFEYKPDGGEAIPGMTGGFILYPASMLIRMGHVYDGECLTTLLRSEWGRIQADIALLSADKTYTERSERLNQYLTLNIFSVEL